jgi:hypothetical protein
MKLGFNPDAADHVTPGMRPSEYMRMARPELFSDSGGRSAYHLDRAVFDHHLGTLTSRNQHQAFELFCRDLCGRLICPNLKPATGPEGGGDSKADTETISVAEEIKVLHYIGQPAAGQERWAFAFSAKEDWASKVRSDVAGLAATGRPYTKVIFVTSRFAPAKTRAKIEDELSRANPFTVEIHDRTWILKAVIDDGNIDLAISQLSVGERIGDATLGPEDYRRSQQLEALERALQDPTAYDQREMERVNDALAAAILSRDLERSRFETDGRFDRAIRLADRFGSRRQRVEARYEQLWAAFYWFDDIDRLNEGFDAVAALAYESDDAETIELISNLVQNLANASSLGHATADSLKLEERRDALVAALEVLAAESDRPNNALEARTSLLFTAATRAMIAHDTDALKALWPQFSDVITRAEGLSEYRAERLEPFVELFGRAAGSDETYNRLVEDMAAFISKRTGNARGGLVLLKRANQLDIEEDRLDVIRLLGRATTQLAQREHVETFIEAAYSLAVAYRGAGMLWAARAAAMFSVATVFAETERDSDAPVSIVPTLTLLGRIDAELRLLPEFLDVVRLIRGCRATLPLDEPSRARIDERLTEFDALLAASLLRTSIEERCALERLPDVLGALDLHASQAALLYGLGHQDVLEGDSADVEAIAWADVFTKWAAELPDDIAERPVLLNGEDSQIQVTRVAGMEVRVTTSGSSTAIVAGQALLTVIDAVFSTMLEAGVAAHVERFDVQVLEDATLSKPAFEFDEMSMSAQLNWPAGETPTSSKLDGAAHDAFTDLTVHIVLAACVVKDPMGLFQGLYEKEALGERIHAAIASVNSRSRAFNSPLSRIGSWFELGGAEYPLRPEAPILAAVPSSAPKRANEEALDRESWKRDHRKVAAKSIINYRLWEQAGWLGLMLAVYPDGVPPLIGLHFTNGELGRKIFSDWRDRFGERDDQDAIHLAIIRDLPGHPPSHYGALLQPGLDVNDESVTVMVSSRLKILEPESDINLRRFLEAYDREKAYWIAPAFVGPDGSPRLLRELAILKHRLPVRRFDDIGDGDVEAIVRALLGPTETA